MEDRLYPPYSCSDCFVNYHRDPSPWTCPKCGGVWIATQDLTTYPFDLDRIQGLVHQEAKRRWPDLMTAESEGLALAEEAGEVCRAIIKRKEGTRGTRDEWTEQLKIEMGQVVCVLMNIAEIEGVRLSECIELAWDKFKAKPDTEPMNL